MSKKFIKIMSAIMAISVIMCVRPTSVHADITSDKAKIKQVQTQRNDLESKVEFVNKQHEIIVSKISSNEKNITITQNNIKKTKINIVKAETNIKAEQVIYDKRMRVMYMNGTSSYIEVILSSNGITDFISRVDNIKRIVTFDQNVIDNLKTKQAAINIKKEVLEAGNIKLLALRSDNKKDLATLIKQKSDQDVLSSKLDSLEKQYGAQLVIDEAILVRQAIKARKVAEEKQASINAQEAKKQVSNTPQANTPITSNSSDLDLLARLITAEAGGESYNAQVAVGAVVLNRVKSSSFPSSIREVIYQKTYAHYEFTPVLNGNINRTATASAMQAANEALSGKDPTNNALFFYSGSKPSGLTAPQPVSIIIGNLTFINML